MRWIYPLIIVALGYYFYSPSPPGWKEPWKTSLHLSFLNVFGFPSRIVEALGLDYIAFNRYFWENFFGYSLSVTAMDDEFIVEDTTIEGFEVRLYRLKSIPVSEVTPALVFYHGGGWVYSSYMVLDSTVKRMALNLGISAMAMNYRRAPEHPSPIPLEDCLTVTKYYMKNAQKFNIDPNRVVLSGDSAGGHLAATVSMKLAAEKFSHQPKLQVLFFPCIQGINLNTPSYLARKDGPWLTQPAMAFYYSMHAEGKLNKMKDFLNNQHVPRSIMEELSQYMKLSDLPDDEYLNNYQLVSSPDTVPYWDELKDILLDPYYSPLFAPNELFADQPRTYINACQYDVLRDEAIWYGKRLQAAGVPTQIDIALCFHAWTLYTEDLQSAREEMKKITDYIAQHL